MKIRFQYGDRVAVVPGSAVDAAVKAGREELLVLLLLADAAEESPDAIAARAGLDAEKVRNAIAFWRGTGVIALTEEETPRAPAATDAAGSATPLKPHREAELPHYTGDELADILEKRKDAAVLVDACQRSLGRMCNPHEINIILGLSDYLRLDNEYILLLINYCVRNGKKSLRYIEKTAFSLYDQDIADVPSLTAWMARGDALKSAEGELRTMLGIGARALTGKETGMFTRWLCDFGFSVEIIRMAYEITVDANKTKVLDYMNGILERWHADGLDTAEKIRAQAQERAARQNGAPQKEGGSFVTDDFFDAALRRSLGDAYTQTVGTEHK